MGRIRRPPGEPAAKHAWLRRLGTVLARRLGLDSNPLRRRSDRIEAWMCAALLVLLLAGAPLLAIMTGSWVRASGLAEMRAERSWRQVAAIALESAPAASPYLPLSTEWVTGRLADSAPGPRQRQIPVSPGVTAGTTVHVWVDAAGQIRVRPLLPGQLAARVALAEVSVPIAWAMTVVILAETGRWLLTRRRLAAWDRAWQAIGPRWTQLR
jgi:hypothetical protein